MKTNLKVEGKIRNGRTRARNEIRFRSAIKQTGRYIGNVILAFVGVVAMGLANGHVLIAVVIIAVIAAFWTLAQILGDRKIIQV